MFNLALFLHSLLLVYLLPPIDQARVMFLFPLPPSYELYLRTN
ncbi:hypothetical protein GLYMA_16G195251v4 [Glycine max]|nr:hypothetical protein GLYMA_16G195251v4 [Glycine max]KAH1152028.1 hypothetical protein GYH30_045498 [Glycine max]